VPGVVSKLIRPIAALSAVFFVAVGLVACGSSGVSSNAVVSVNGQQITQDAYNHWLSVAAASSAATLPGQKAPKPVVPEPPDYTACIAHLKTIEPKPAKGQKPKTEGELKTQCEQQFKALQQQVLGFLISSEWVLGEAKELGIKVSEKEVAARLNQLKKQQFPKEAEFQKFLASTGQSVSDLLLRVKLSMVSQKIQEKVTKGGKKSTSEAEVAKYYNEHKSQFGQQERRNLRIVLTKTEAQAKQAKSEIESGQSFASVAKSKSIDPTSKDNGGELPGVVKGEEEKALDTAVFEAKKGVLGGPVKTPFGYYVYEVKSVTPATQQTLDQVKAEIKQQLSSQGQQQALTKFVKEFKSKWKSRTECRTGYVVQDCEQYKAPKGTSTTAAE
jgi:foldase protein PrsA